MGEPGYPFAIGLAVLCGFAIYAVRAMPKPLAFIGMAAGVALMILDVAQLRSYTWPTVLAFLGLGLLVGAAIWGHRIYSAHFVIEKPTPIQSSNLIAEWKMLGNIQSNTVLQWLTVIIRKEPNGTITFNSYQGGPLQNAGFIPPAPHGFMMGLCQIFNHGSVPIFSIRMEFDLRLHEMVSDPSNPANQISAATPLFTYKIPNLTLKIDSGPNNPLNIAFLNMTPYAAVIFLPKEMTGIPLGQDKQSLPIKQPNLMDAALAVPRGDPVPLVLPPLFQAN